MRTGGKKKKKKKKKSRFSKLRLVEKVTEAQMKAVCGRSGTGGEGGELSR